MGTEKSFSYGQKKSPMIRLKWLSTATIIKGESMAELSLTHCKYECKYHIVFAPKFRRQVIYGKLKIEIGKILRKLCERAINDERVYRPV